MCGGLKSNPNLKVIIKDLGVAFAVDMYFGLLGFPSEYALGQALV